MTSEKVQCPCCKGSGFIPKEGSVIDDIDALERRIKYRDEGEPLLPPSPEEVLALIAEIRRLQGILSDYNGTTKEQLMARVEKLERENLALGRMLTSVKYAKHRRCGCGGTCIVTSKIMGDGRRYYWVECRKCRDVGTVESTEAQAWAAWDGVE